MTAADPRTGLAAIERAYRLDSTPVLLWQRGQLRLRTGDSGGVDDLARATQQSPERLCDVFLNWLASSDRIDNAQLAQARAQCADRR